MDVNDAKRLYRYMPTNPRLILVLVLALIIA
jgi:hypothetical protein